MGRKFAKFIIFLLGGALGFGICATINTILVQIGYGGFGTLFKPWITLTIYIVSIILFAIIFIILSNSIIDGFWKFLTWCINKLTKQSLPQMMAGVIGLIIGLVIASLTGNLVESIGIRWVELTIKVCLYVGLAYIGAAIAKKYSSEISFTKFSSRFRKVGGDYKSSEENAASAKILDTSAIIDGRFIDICKTGIVEGDIVVPVFVVEELQKLADSADDLKRAKGRRGLDIIKSMKTDLTEQLIIDETDYDGIREVDRKLIMLASDMKGTIVTNDYNLNKVASVQSVSVFNINDLANAIKTVVIPGEDLCLTIIKDGKEHGQGIAYLEDGTMVVVEGGKNHVGESVDMIVTSVLQTSAGRMIFTKIK